MPDLVQRLQAKDMDAFRALVESAPAMLWLGDQNGHCIFLNSELRRFWGVGSVDLSEFDWNSTVHPDDQAGMAEPYMQAMASRSPFEVEARYRRYDGVFRIMRTSARPRFSTDGVFLGMAGVNTDVTEQRQAEEALRRSSEQLQLALDASQGIGTWVWEVSRDVVVADHRFARAFGVDAEEAARGVPIQVFVDAIVEEDRARVKESIEASIRDHTIYRCEYRVMTNEGQLRWLVATGRCEFDAAGNPTRFPGAVVDISERKAAEQHKELLAGELSHRIKNIFTVVQGMTTMSAREHPEARDAFEELAGRFRAMAAAYACVTPASDDVLASGSLRKLLEVLFAPYAGNGLQRVTVEGPDIAIGSKAASALALILHERATNAAKYGALSQDGSVLLRIERAAGQCRLFWSETGGPEILAPPTSRGFGSRLIRSAAASLDGDLNIEWVREGLRWIMTAPEEKLRS